MKTNMLLTILLAGMTLFLANCSKSNNSGTTATTCASGQVNTTAGCGYVSSYCSANTALVNGYCQPISSTSTTGPVCQGKSGYVGTQIGCLPEGTCSAYRGYYGVAYYGYTTSRGTAECFPQTY
ncbi:MAG: hypothetical protein J7501_03255 [Bdellovibrio sp.]|nr:hypothetical protein [Bdellovibrio sp.]